MCAVQMVWEWNGKLPGRHFCLRVIHIMPVTLNCINQQAWEMFSDTKWLSNTWNKYNGLFSELVPKVVWEIQHCMCHWLALKKSNASWNPCVWIWKRWKQYKTWFPKQALKWIKSHSKLMKIQKKMVLVNKSKWQSLGWFTTWERWCRTTVSLSSSY